MKKIVERINIVAHIFFLVGLLYLTCRYFIVHQNTTMVYTRYDEAAIACVLLLAVGIVLLPYLISQKSSIIYVDRLKDTTKDTAKLGSDAINNQVDVLTHFTQSITQIRSIDNTTIATIEKILSLLCASIHAGQGVVYKINKEQAYAALIASYAFVAKENQIAKYEFGEGLIGLAAKENRMMKLDNIPQGYINIFSGLGSSSPAFLYILPFGNAESDVLGILEVALFKDLTNTDFQLIEEAKVNMASIISQL